MARYSTTTYTILIKGGDIGACNVYVTMRQGMREVTYNVTDTLTETEEGWQVELTMTQTQSARFRANKPVKFQANVVDQNGYRDPTDIKTDTLDENLLERTL